MLASVVSATGVPGVGTTTFPSEVRVNSVSWLQFVGGVGVIGLTSPLTDGSNSEKYSAAAVNALPCCAALG